MIREIVQQNLIYVLRAVLACVCGGIVGIERQQRNKVAGTKTHVLIALAASLMMIISKYGFLDMLATEGVTYDASRVAAGIAAGAIFLSGGIIFIGKRGNVSGLTTAAGAWVTIGIGMALGAGMYILGISITVLMVIIQQTLHRNIWVMRKPSRVQVTFHIERDKDGEAYKKVIEQLEKHQISFRQFRWEKKSRTSYLLCCQALVPMQYGRDDILNIFSGMEEVEDFEVI